jgi:glycosyltransferase involved in cell wall biosynthesis
VGGNVELIKDEVSGLFAPFDDKRVWIEKTTSLIEDQSFSQTITDGAKKRVSTFTVERMVDELVATFNEIK